MPLLLRQPNPIQHRPNMEILIYVKYIKNIELYLKFIEPDCEQEAERVSNR